MLKSNHDIRVDIRVDVRVDVRVALIICLLVKCLRCLDTLDVVKRLLPHLSSKGSFILWAQVSPNIIVNFASTGPTGPLSLSPPV